MCGINGFNWADASKINAMNLAIKHRGPDGEGLYCSQAVSLGHVRLSILDLSEKGHQPMGLKIKNNNAVDLIYKDELLHESDIIIVFNGEIYNYIEVRDELSQYTFDSDCDTEVILKAYLAWGEECVLHFNGIWAFAIYDKRKDIFFCSKDRYGEKPFFYYAHEDKFVFSSELKGILCHSELGINLEQNLNLDTIELYFNFGFIPAPYTIFHHVYKLEASHSLIYSLDKKVIVKKWQYYELPAYRPNQNKNELINEGRSLLEDAIRIRLRSDVPVGVFLSGGLDSSTVVALSSQLLDINKLNTFSVGFEGKYNELPFAQIVHQRYQTIHHHFEFREEHFKELLDQYSFFYDEPFGDFSGFPLIFLSRETKKDVTVVLGGDGGDEVFGGYAWHKAGSRLDLIYRLPRIIRKFIQKIPLKHQALDQLKRACAASFYDKSEFFAQTTNLFNSPLYAEITKKHLGQALSKGKNSFAEAFRIYDVQFNTLQDLFCVKVDRASMGYALEVRAPFLDQRVVEFAQRIPTKWKQTSKKTKILMREIIKEFLPKEIVYRKKSGFHPPIDTWILNDAYANELGEAINCLQRLCPSIIEYYNSLLKHASKPYIQTFSIKMLIFYNWWKKWVK